MPITALHRVRLPLALMALAGTVPAPSAIAGGYPDKPIRLVVPFAPGGPNDVMARILAQQLAADNGQPVVVDNRAGAGGIIGTDAVAKAPPDGYTLGFISAPFTMSPSLIAKMPYDTRKDLIGVAKVAESPLVLMVPATSPYASLAALLDRARAEPGKLTYGSGGIGSTPHLATEYLGSITHARFLHVPYKGGGESIKALMGGEVDLLLDSITSTGAAIASGRVRALAVGQDTRVAQLPGVPTLREAGVPDFAVTHWVGVVAPAKTPLDVLQTLHRQIVAALHQPDMVRKLKELGASPVGDSAEHFNAFIDVELERWPQVVKQAGIQAQ